MHEKTQPRPGLLQRWIAALLDGENRWGYVRIQPDRFGVTRYRLVIYPPGISAQERRRLRIWRGSPIWGAALWAVLEITLQQFMVAWNALAISSAVVIVAGGVARTLVGEAPWRVRGTGAITMAGHTDLDMVTARGKLLAMAATLTDADKNLDNGLITALEHEALWWRAYDQLAPRRAAVA